MISINAAQASVTHGLLLRHESAEVDVDVIKAEYVAVEPVKVLLSPTKDDDDPRPQGLA